MHHYFEAITNRTGDSLVGYFARVINPATLDTVTLSADNNGTPIVAVSGVENMATTDENGNLSFYVDPGTYHLDLYQPDATTFVFRVQNVAMNSTKGDTGPEGPPGPQGEGLADVMAPTGAALVGFMQAGTGAIARNTLDKARDAVSVRDFGAVGDGLTNDSAAFFAAAKLVSDAGGGRIDVRGGTFVIGNVNLSGLSNIEWVGTGATIKAPGRILCYFNCSGSTNITFSGLIFDQMKSALTTYTPADYENGPLNVPIYANLGASNLSIYDCIFRDLYTTAIYFDKCVKLTVQNNEFLSPVQQQNQWVQHLHIQTSTDVTITTNRFVNSAVSDPGFGVSACFASGVRRFFFQGNYLDFCGRNNAGTHRLGALDFYGDVSDVFVLDNTFSNVMAEAIRLNACFGGKISGNRFTVNANAEASGNTLAITGSTLFGQNKGQRDIEISGNRFEDFSTRAAGTVVIVSYDWGAPSRKISVHDNVFSGCRNIVRVIGPFDRVAIERNSSDSSRGHIVIVNGSGILSDQGSEANSLYDGLVIRGNKISDDSGEGANAVNISLTAATTAFVGTFIVEDNIFRASIPSPAACVFGLMNSSNRANTRSYFRRNEIRGYATGLFYQNHGEAEASGNRLIGVTTPLTESGMTTPVVRRGNRYSAGVQKGRATLVSGVVDVSTAEVTAGDRIILQRVTGSGAIGALMVESITAGSGFQVRSKDATGALVTGDNGQFDWSFDH